MEPNHIVLFKEIQFAVSRLVFGDTDGVLDVYQGIIGRALEQLGVAEQCLLYCHNNEIEHDKHKPEPSLQ